MSIILYMDFDYRNRSVLVARDASLQIFTSGETERSMKIVARR